MFVVAFGCWLGYDALHAKSSLEHVRGDAQRAKQSLLKGNTADAAKWAHEAVADAESAHTATHSLPWKMVSVVPWLGSPFASGQQISDVVLGLAADVLAPSAEVGEAISPDKLLAQNGQIDLGLLRDAAPRLSEIASAANELDVQARAISPPEYLSSVRGARAALQDQVSDVARLLDGTALAARLAPSMMGADGPRTYFMGFQTNAEARGTGGLLGGFGILRFDDGTPAVETLGPNTELNKAFGPIDLGAEFNTQYSYLKATTDFRNSNFSSHFPYAAQIWKSLWEQQSGTQVDGVVSVDPVALSYVLGAVGPVTMPTGETITKDNVVELTESTVYSRFATDNTARKAYLQGIASEVVKKMTGRLSAPRQLLEALGKGVSEGRIAVWSDVPAEQQALEQTRLAHAVPDDPAPYAEVLVNNIGGNKLDYYLTRQIEYSAAVCDSATRKSSVTIRLTNNVPDQPLPDYVAGAEGMLAMPLDVPRFTNVVAVSLLATTHAKLTGAFVNGEKTPIFIGSERNHPLFDIQVPVPRGQTAEVRFELTEPTAPGAPRVPIQPLIDTVYPAVSVPQCPG